MGDRTSYPPGTFCWVDLGTTDAEAARAFYTALFGWNAEPVVDPAHPGTARSYTVLKVGDRMNAGMAAMTDDAPSNWLVYFTVASCDVAQAIVEARDGQVLVPPAELPTGRFAIARDPQGAAFGLFEGDVDD